MIMTRVVLGLLFEPHGNILIAKRNYHKKYGGLWEFPGGKIEQRETIEEALVREILEEMNAPIQIKHVYNGYIFAYENLKAEFIPVSGSITPTDIRLNEHEDFKFISIDEIGEFDFSPFDYEAIEMLESRQI